MDESIQGDVGGGDLATSAAVSGDAWDAMSQGGEADVAAGDQQPQQDTAATDDALKTEDTTQAVEKELEKSSSVEEFPNPYPVDNPQHKAWEGLKTHKEQILAEKRAMEPIIQRVESLGGTRILDVLEPLLTITEPGAQAVAAGKNLADSLYADDPLVGESASEGFYERDKNIYAAWWLEEQGIKPTDWKEFKEWKTNGGTVIPPGYIPGFPVPNEDGFVIITAPDGTPVELNTNDAVQNWHYQQAKATWDRDQKEAATKAQEAASLKMQQQQQQQQDAEKRSSDFVAGCDADLDEEFGAIDIKVSDLPTSLGVSETEAAKLLVSGIARNWMDKDAGYQKAFRQGIEIARRGGQRADSSRAALRRTAKAHFEKASEYVKGLFDELHGYRAKAGTLHTAPKIPQSAAAAVAGIDNTPSSRPQQQYTDPLDEIWA